MRASLRSSGVPSRAHDAGSRSGRGAGDGGGSRKRYAATVEKGPNAWKREWSSFISGIDMKTVRSGVSSVALKPSQDYGQMVQLQPDEPRQRRRASAAEGLSGAAPLHKRPRAGSEACEAPRENQAADALGDDVESVSSFDGIATMATFGYLFSSPAEKRAEREQKQRQELEAQKQQRHEEALRKKMKRLELLKMRKLRQLLVAHKKAERRDGKNNTDGSAAPDDGEADAESHGSAASAPSSGSVEGGSERRVAALVAQVEQDEEVQRLCAEIQGESERYLSKHQRSLFEAQQRGLNLSGMTRKQVREFLHLSVSKEQQLAEERQKSFRPHQLLDDKLEWYQQGPHPLDLLSERLVMKKALKRGKQMALRYNFLLPHPSWLAKRAQRRREAVLVSLGTRRAFQYDDDDDGGGGRGTDTAACVPASNVTTSAAAKASSAISHLSILDRRSIAKDSLERRVVKARETAEAIRRANLSTNFLSTALVHRPPRDP